MRLLHAPVHEGLMKALTDIFAGFPADKVIQRQFKANKKWGSHDRRLFAEGTYEIVRWWRRLLYVCDLEFPTEPRRDVLVAVIEAWAGLNDVTLGKNVPRGRPTNVRAQWDDPGLPRAVRHAVPDWLDAWGEAQLGEAWEPALAALNTQAPVYLRANTLRTTAEKLVRDLASENVAAELVEGDCVRLAARPNVFLTKAFKAGHFEVQDWSSQQAAPATGCQPGERVVDACAGAGGKSLHLAALMRNKGKIIAMDVTEKKLVALRERASRDGASIIETRLIESTKVIKRQAGTADRLLLDVPCTGLGVLRRNPDKKWKLTLEEVERLKQIQRDILFSYPQMLKAGGTLVYATCSIVPDENERQVEAFLAASPGFRLESQRLFMPEAGGRDGFFVATLTKSDPS